MKKRTRTNMSASKAWKEGRKERPVRINTKEVLWIKSRKFYDNLDRFFGSQGYRPKLG